MPAQISLTGVSYRTADGTELIKDATVALGCERTGLVGRNGIGKSTLARLITGELSCSSGSVSVEGRIASLPQTLAHSSTDTLADIMRVADALARLDRLERGRPRDGDLDQADWALPQRTDMALHQMGLANMALDRPATELSGGQATRAMLAGLLVEAPDFLILDEPTNSLDADGRAALYTFMGQWRKGALVISHDRALLRLMDRTLELSSLGLKSYGGGYDLYVEQQQIEQAAAQRALDDAHRAQARTMAAVQQQRERQARRNAAGRKSRKRHDMPKSWLDGQAERAQSTMGRSGRIADQRQSAAADRLNEAREAVRQAAPLSFSLPPSGLAAHTLVVSFEDVSFGWPGSPALVQDLAFRLRGPERLAVRGPNGSGKSTLIRVITGDVTPLSGQISVGIAPAILDQRVSLLHPDDTLLESFRRGNPDATDNHAHAALARFLFRKDDVHKRVSALSGGERMRAGLACVLMAATPPQFLILDEPTNHLDLDSIAAMEAALRDYDGALLAVSHDTSFLEAINVSRDITL